MTALELSLMEWLQGCMNPVLTAICAAFSMLGEQILLIAIPGIFYWGIDKRVGKRIGSAVILSLLISPFVKNLFLRTRPYLEEGSHVVCYRAPDIGEDPNNVLTQGYSFPSVHSSNAFTLFGSVFLTFRRKKWLRILCGVLTLGVGLSRILLGCHYPTDVLGGYAIGALTLWFSFAVESKIKRKWLFRLAVLLVAIPGWFFCHSTDFFSVYGLMAGYLVADELETRKVNFSPARDIPHVLLRVAGGIVLFVVLYFLLKLPFSSAFLDSDTFPAHLVRAARYAILTVVELAVYPMVFRKEK